MPKDKLLNEFKTENNEETIVIRVMQTDKGIQVLVDGETPDVIVNGDVLYSKYDKEEYKHIPPAFRSFVEEHSQSYTTISKENGRVLVRDIFISGRDYDVDFPSNRAKNKDILITNWLNDYKKINDYLDEPVPNGKEDFENLIKQIKNIGYDFKFAYSGNEYDNTYSLVVPMNEFDLAKIKACLSLWDAYDKELEKYI